MQQAAGDETGWTPVSISQFDARLVTDVWLNGIYLGQHKGDARFRFVIVNGLLATGIASD